MNTNETSIVGASVGASLAHEGRFYATHGLKVLCSTKRKSDSTSEKPRLMRMDCLAFDEISHTSRSTT